jgi:hypothetical protein
VNDKETEKSALRSKVEQAPKCGSKKKKKSFLVSGNVAVCLGDKRPELAGNMKLYSRPCITLPYIREIKVMIAVSIVTGCWPDGREIWVPFPAAVKQHSDWL